MLKIEIDKNTAKRLADALKKYPSIAEPILQKAVHASQAELAKRTLKNNPVPWRTGNLLHSFRYKTSYLKGVWFPTAPYAAAVDQGARIPPRVIKPRRKKALYWPGAEHPVKMVRHPGGVIRPRRFMQKIRDRSEAAVVKVFERAVEKINNKITRL